ncbi:MAG: 23S rRNA (guanosine(2251)-2'-O)-methyltransferase RlmB [Clostridia bacterium]|nr:23S rRNA (guanosine(2251)-2'-O)-methyltransferase RlmB [Clostridia bacterium]
MLDNQTEQKNENLICGRNAVLEALRSGREIDRVLVAHGVSGGSVTAIVAKCAQRGILIKEISPQKLDYYCGNVNHQGIAVFLASQEYSTVEDILQTAKDRNEKPFIIICDEIEDPHNLGAIIRTAEACGVHGVIIPKRRSASLNATVAKAASGALEYVKVAGVTNLANTIDDLKEAGVWVFGADMDGEDYAGTDFDCPCALVIGNEGKGIGALVAKKCDAIVSLPMSGKINSLNASVAAAVLMYEVVRKRK